MRVSDSVVYLGRKPSVYANRVLKDLRLVESPTPTEPILEYFGIDVLELKSAEEAELTRRAGQDGSISAFLCIKDDPPTIFVRGEDSLERRRMSIFHECGHFDLPWHRGVNYMCDLSDGEISKLKTLEKDAFEYAGHLLFPTDSFVPMVEQMPISIQTIEEMSHIYQASFEATAIRYIGVSRTPCAIIYMIPNHQTDAFQHPYVVKYSIKTKSFHRYRKPGDPLQGHPLIDACFCSGDYEEGRIPATIFGSLKKHSYDIQLKPHGYDQVCALLVQDDIQTSFL